MAVRQAGAHRVVQVIMAEIQVIHDGERRGRAIDPGDRDRPVQRHHRCRREHRELIVQRHDLVPAGAAASAAPACTALIAAWIWYGPAGCSQAPPDDGPAPGDEGAVPQRPVLIGQSAVPAGTRGPARLGEQHQREQVQHIVSS